jgi:hypothetical protein
MARKTMARKTTDNDCIFRDRFKVFRIGITSAKSLKILRLRPGGAAMAFRLPLQWLPGNARS